MSKQKHISIRIDEETLQKIHYVAKCDGRSANGQIIFLINSRIRDFEKEHGKIESTETKS
ncbi:MAG: Arc family DNA-binding protein [Clostridiales bacterium]|nr:Arc family DNA-binding protein [Clostridiales bacterium]